MVVGIIVSVIGTYMKTATDFTVRYALDRFELFKQKGEESTKKVIEKLNSDHEFREFIFQGEMRAYMASLSYGITSAIAFGMAVFTIYSQELAAVHHLAKYVLAVSGICLYLAGTKFLSGAYLGRGLILAAKAKFELE